MANVILNGNGYSDDGSQSRDMRGGGYRNWMLPMLSDAAVEINLAKAAQTYATQAQTYAAALQGTSTTSVTVSSGSISLTTQINKQFAAGQFIIINRIASPTTYMWGTVTSYDSSTGNLVLNSITTSGSGTFTDWQISLSGAQGATGPTNRAFIRAKSATYTVVLGDIGCVIDCTGTFTVNLTAASTLGDGFYVWIRNAGSGDITIDPNSSETIDSASTTIIASGNYALIQCDGTSWKTTFSNSIYAKKLPILSDTTGYIPASSLETIVDGNNYYLSAMGSVAAVYWIPEQSLFVILSNTSPYIFTSPDGKVWTGRSNTLAVGPACIAYNGTYWLVSNVSNTTWTKSTNLITWSSATGPATSTNVASCGSVFIATDNSNAGTYYTSSDGSSWTTRQSPTDTMTPIVGNSTTRVVASTLNAAVFYSTDSGTTWAPSTTQPSTAIRQLAYGGGRFVGMSTNSTATHYSTDGITWAAGGTSGSSALRSIFYGNGLFVVVGDSGFIATSSNAATWTSRTSGVTAALNHVIYAGGKFVAVGQSTSTVPTVLTSTDGTAWTRQTSGLPTDSTSAYWVYHNGTTYYLAVGPNIYTSTDAVTWALAGARSLLLSNYIYTCINGTTFYATENSNLYTSTNATTWTQVNNSVIKADAVSNYGSEIYINRRGIAKSTDSGSSWTPVLKGVFITPTEYNSWVLTNRTFIAGGVYSNWYATTTDGITWTQRTFPSPYNFSASACFVNSRLYLRTTADSTVISSADGITWTTESNSWNLGAQAAAGRVFQFRNCWLSGNATYIHTQGSLTDQPATRIGNPGMSANRSIASSSTVLTFANSSVVSVIDSSVNPKGAFV